MNRSGIRKKEGVAPRQILFSTQNQQSVGVVVSNDGVTADAQGKKIIRAGTPLDGNLEARETVFKKSTGTTPAGVLLSDVDVTLGNDNATCLIWGFINLDRLEAEVITLLTEDVKTSLSGKITFLKD